MDSDINYLKIGKASEIKNRKDRRTFRFFEILPGALSWLTLILIFIISWLYPVWAVVFVVLFDTYWFFKTLFFTIHAVHTFKILRKSLKADWLIELKNLPKEKYNLQGISSWEDIYHLIIFPMVIEEYEVVRETFLAIEKSNYPLEKLIVVLSYEERKENHGKEVAEKIKDEFENKFFKLLITKHPDGIEGELAGKGANETWAARMAKEEIIDDLKIPYERVVVSSFDVDTAISPNYFACLSYRYLTAKNPLRSSFQPIPFFTNNIWQAPALARVISFSATFFQFIQQSRPEKMTTFSSHSMPFASLIEIDFWQTNVVSEDSRIFWQFYLFYNGDWEVVPLFYPVNMDANVDRTFWGTMVNQYKQQRRWGYGAHDLAYIFFGFTKNKKISLKDKLSWGFVALEGFYSWATSALIIFLLGWLPNILGGARFSTTIISFNLPKITSYIMTAATVGLVIMAILSFWFLPPRPPRFGKFRYVWMVLQWIFVPLAMIVFGCVPALEAQTRLIFGKYMGFWVTPKHRQGSP